MGMFSSSSEGEQDKEAPARSAAKEGNLSIVAAGMRVIGQLITSGVVKVEGTIEGSVRADRQVLIAKGGVVEGDVYTREAIVGGRVAGSIFAEERVEVQTKSMVSGDIVTQRLMVHEGGEVNGTVQMGDPKVLKQAMESKVRSGPHHRPREPRPLTARDPAQERPYSAVTSREP